MSTALEPRHVHPLKWHQAIAVARETCARFFRDGRGPADAVRAYGLAAAVSGWAGAVNAIAELHNASPAGCGWLDRGAMGPQRGVDACAGEMESATAVRKWDRRPLEAARMEPPHPAMRACAD